MIYTPEKAFNMNNSLDSMPSDTSEDFSKLQMMRFSPYKFSSNTPTTDDISSKYNQNPTKHHIKRGSGSLGTRTGSNLFSIDTSNTTFVPPKVLTPHQNASKKLTKTSQDLSETLEVASNGDRDLLKRKLSDNHTYDYQNFIKNRMKYFKPSIITEKQQVQNQTVVTNESDLRSRVETNSSKISNPSNKMTKLNIPLRHENIKINTPGMSIEDYSDANLLSSNRLLFDKYTDDFLVPKQATSIYVNTFDLRNPLQTISSVTEEMSRQYVSPAKVIDGNLAYRGRFHLPGKLTDGSNNNKVEKGKSLEALQKEHKYANPVFLKRKSEAELEQFNSYSKNQKENAANVIDFHSPLRDYTNKAVVRSPLQPSLANSGPKPIRRDKENQMPYQYLNYRSAEKNETPEFRSKTPDISNKNIKNSSQKEQQSKRSLIEGFNSLKTHGSQIKLQNESKNMNLFDRLTKGDSKSSFLDTSKESSIRQTLSEHKETSNAKAGISTQNKQSVPLERNSVKEMRNVHSINSHPAQVNSINYRSTPSSSLIEDNKSKIVSSAQVLNIIAANIQNKPQAQVDTEKQSSLRTRQDEDLSEFIRIENGVFQEEQMFMSPCLLSESFMIKREQSQQEKFLLPLKLEDATKKVVPTAVAEKEKHVKQRNNSCVVPVFQIQAADFTGNLSPKIDFVVENDDLKINKPRSQATIRRVSLPTNSLEEITQDLNKKSPIVFSKVKQINPPTAKKLQDTERIYDLDNSATKNHSANKDQRGVHSEESTSNLHKKHIINDFSTTTQKIRDLIKKKNEGILMNMLTKSNSKTNLAKSLKQTCLEASAHSYQNESTNSNLEPTSLFQLPVNLATIQETNSTCAGPTMKLENRQRQEPEKDFISASQLADRCISEPTGYYMPKNADFENQISKSFDDFKSFKDKIVNFEVRSNSMIQLNTNHYTLPELHFDNSQSMKKAKSETRLNDSRLKYHLIKQTPNITPKQKQEMKPFKSPSIDFQRSRGSTQEKEILFRSAKPEKSSKHSSTREPSLERKDKSSISRLFNSKRSSVSIDKNRDFPSGLTIQTPSNLETYTIVQKSKKSMTPVSRPKSRSNKSNLSEYYTRTRVPLEIISGHENTNPLDKRASLKDLQIPCREYARTSKSQRKISSFY